MKIKNIGRVKQMKRMPETPRVPEVPRVPTFKTNKTYQVVSPRKYKVHGSLFDFWFDEEQKKELGTDKENHKE